MSPPQSVSGEEVKIEHIGSEKLFWLIDLVAQWLVLCTYG